MQVRCFRCLCCKKHQNISKQYSSMAFRVSNAIIVAGISIDSVTIRSLRPGHAPVHGARLTLVSSAVQRSCRKSGPARFDSTPPSMVFRVSNAIIVAGTSIDSATIRSLQPGHAPSPWGPSGSALRCTVQLIFRVFGNATPPTPGVIHLFR
jgi:hypothetical protein